jgi:hypothetical protein
MFLLASSRLAFCIAFWISPAIIDVEGAWSVSRVACTEWSVADDWETSCDACPQAASGNNRNNASMRNVTGFMDVLLFEIDLGESVGLARRGLAESGNSTEV